MTTSTAHNAPHAALSPQPPHSDGLPAWWADYAHARYCLEQQEHTAAERALQHLCEQWPERAEPHALLAILFRRQSRWQAAFDHAQQALSLPRPTDGSDQFEPEAWDLLPLEALAHISWYAGESVAARDAIERLQHDRRVPAHIRARAHYLSGWYLARAPFAWTRRLRVPPHVLTESESASTPALVRNPGDDGYMLLSRLVDYDTYPSGDGAFRNARSHSHGALAFLDAAAQPQHWTRLDDSQLLAQSQLDTRTLRHYGLEDVRPVWWRDAWWFTATCFHFPPAGSPSVVLGRLDIDTQARTARVARVIPLRYHARQVAEKNWLPFVDRTSGELLLHYHAEPLTLLRPDVDTGACTVVHQQAAPVTLEQYRGSAAPIPWRDGYLYMLHSSNRRPGHVIYLHRLVELDAAYNVTRMTRPFHLRHVSTEYCSSICLSHDGAELRFGHSWLDAETWLSALATSTVEDMLLPLDAFTLPTAPVVAQPHPALPAWWPTYRRQLNEALIGNPQSATAGLQELAATHPERAELHYQQARLARQRDAFLDAYRPATLAVASAMHPPDDGSDNLEPDAWRTGPLHELAISAWHQREWEVGRTAADLLRHDPRVTTLQRRRAIGHLSWYLDPLPVSDTRPVSLPANLLASYEVPCNGSLAPLPQGHGVLLAQRVVNYRLQPDRSNVIRDGDSGWQTRTRTLLAHLASDGTPHTDTHWQPLHDDLLASLANVDVRRSHGLGMEDLRLIWWRDAWWFTACTSQLAAAKSLQNDMLLGRIAFTQRDEGAGTHAYVDHLVRLKLPDRATVEKNWLPFVTAAGDLRLLHGIDPITILSVDSHTGACTRERVVVPPIAMTDYRNSAGPLPWNNGYLIVTHEVAWLIDDTCYQHRFVELDADFQITRLSAPFCLRDRGVEYILGLTPAGNATDLLLHHSWNDEEAWISTVSRSVVNDLLLPIDDLLPDAQP